MFSKSVFEPYFSLDEINHLESIGVSSDHPLFYFNNNVTDSSGRFAASLFNTLESFKMVSSINSQWFESKKKEVLQKDVSVANATLAEFRCYHCLVSAFGESNVVAVSPTKGQRTPDFCVNNGKEKIFIEVNSPQLGGSEINKRHINLVSGSTEKIRIVESFIAPLGRKKDMTLRESAISKISGAKNNVEQLNLKAINILYLDFQTEMISDIIDYVGMPFPLSTNRTRGGGGDGGFYSNILWYALYAKKKTPIFDGETLNQIDGIPTTIKSKMLFDGKFANNKTKNVSCVICSFPDACIICENPHATTKLSDSTMRHLCSLFRFNIEHSFMRFTNKFLKGTIRNNEKFLFKLSKNKFYSW